MELSFIVIFLLALVCLVATVLHQRKHLKNDRFSRARKQFAAATITAEDPKHHFDGRSARVVRELVDDSNSESTTYALTIYAVNAQGEYFVFKSTGDQFLLKPLDHVLARIILKRDYKPPPSEVG